MDFKNDDTDEDDRFTPNCTVTVETVMMKKVNLTKNFE